MGVKVNQWRFSVIFIVVVVFSCSEFWSFIYCCNGCQPTDSRVYDCLLRGQNQLWRTLINGELDFLHLCLTCVRCRHVSEGGNTAGERSFPMAGDNAWQYGDSRLSTQSRQRGHSLLRPRR